MIRYLSTASPKALAGTALLRLDFNTTDDWRMRAVLPTIKLLLKTSGRIVIVSHRGRPVGFDKKLSLRGDAAKLSKLLGGKKVTFINHFRFVEIKKQVAAAPRGSIFLLDNLRFLSGEERNDAKLARALASIADFYVNDAFAVSHRANASVVAITKFLPSYAGIEMENEIKSLGEAIIKPRRPVVLVLGGAKASDKLGVITYFKKKADWFLLGGGCANTMLWLKGMDVKKSIKDSDSKELAVLKKIAAYKNMVLPVDFVWGNSGKKIAPSWMSGLTRCARSAKRSLRRRRSFGAGRSDSSRRSDIRRGVSLSRVRSLKIKKLFPFPAGERR